MNPLAAALAAAPHPSKVGAVSATAEFRRIRDAPRRRWQEDPRLPPVTAWLTEKYRKPGGTMVLREVQAAVLQDLHDYRGCFAPIRTGGGKTLVSLIAATVLEAQRPVLLVPAALRDKTRRESDELAKHWRLQAIRILSYESLGRVNYHHTLVNYAPDLLIGDECHFLKNTKAGVTRSVKECVTRCRPAQLWMSGSITSRSLKEYWHLLRWCLQDRAPLPANPMELLTWCWALDEKIQDGIRIPPGALLEISPPEPDDGLGIIAARRRYGRRLMSTPGVVGTGGAMPPVGLQIRTVGLEPTPVIAEAVRVMQETYETPCGLPFETAVELWRHERELSCGLYYRWKTQPSFEWLVARKEWSKFCREVLKKSRTLYTPQAVVDAIEGDRLKDGGVLSRWKAIQSSFKPVTEPVWLDDQTLTWAAGWLEDQKGICWILHRAFGERLSSISGVPYFAQDGRSQNGIVIDQWDGPAIAGSGCSKGFNLQGTPYTKAKHYRNLVITSGSKNGPEEQRISRTHRDGQERDDVEVTYLQTLEGDRKALDQARDDALYVEATTLQPQRLTIATWI